MQLGVRSLRLLLVCAVVAVVATTGWGLFEAQSANTLREERDLLKATADARALARIDSKKRECAEAAKRSFREAGYTENPKADAPFVAETFTDHYSRKYDRCFIELILTGFHDRKGTETREIWDVDERRDFGGYYWISSDTKKYWEQKPVMCRMGRPGGDVAFCQSKPQWENYEDEMMNS